MNNKQDNTEAIFTVTIEDIQEESKRLIGRQLTDEKLIDAADAIDSGLSTGILIVFESAINQAVEINNQQ